MEIIKLEGLTKKYNDKTVLDQLELTFHSGQSVAFVGHNGCGKSTLLKVLAKLVAPTAGSVVYQKPLLFHYVPERFAPLSFTARTYLTHMGRLDGLGTEEIKKQIEELGTDFLLAELLDTPIKFLSKGTLQKIAVIQTLLKTPDVLLLDEPLSGQDVESQKVFVRKISQLREQNVTIFMSCHEQSLLDSIAEDIYTIKNGQLKVFEPENKKIYTVLLENAKDLPLLGGMKKYGRYYQYPVPEESCDQLLMELLQRGWKLKGMYDEKGN